MTYSLKDLFDDIRNSGKSGVCKDGIQDIVITRSDNRTSVHIDVDMRHVFNHEEDIVMAWNGNVLSIPKSDYSYNVEKHIYVYNSLINYENEYTTSFILSNSRFEKNINSYTTIHHFAYKFMHVDCSFRQVDDDVMNIYIGGISLDT